MKTSATPTEKRDKQAITPGDMVQRARDLAPVLRQRAGQAETLRRLPDDTVQDFCEAGLFRIIQPARFGGHELPISALVDVAVEAGRGCGSSAWCLSLLAAHNWIVSLFAEKAQEEVLGSNPDALVSTAFAAQGTARPVEGGYRFSGRWQFTSGCDHAHWIVVGGNVEREPQASTTSAFTPNTRTFLLPAGDYHIDDTWFVAGLRGTGSKDVVVNDVFVPAYRTFSLEEVAAGHPPGAGVHPAPLFRLPLTAVLAMAVAGPALGIGVGALETYQEQMQSRIMTYTGVKMAQQVPAQIRLAEAAAALDAVQLLVRRDAEEMMQVVTAGEALTLHQRARYRRDAVYAVTLCTRVVDQLFAASGGHALYDHQPLQGAFRDLHALSAHAFLNPDVAGELFGRVALGLEPNGII